MAPPDHPVDVDLVEEDGRLVIAASGITITDAMITALRDADQR